MAKPRKKDNGAPQNGGDMTSTIDRDRLAQRAYELYLARGGEDGRDLEDWLAAERELLDREKPQTRSQELRKPSPPSGTSESGANRITAPSLSGTPSVRTSDMKGPICLGGKFTTPTTSLPTNSDARYRWVSCADEFFSPIPGPKSIVSL